MLIESLLIVILISIWIGFYLILKQQGRLLLRLDALQHPPAPDAEPAEPQGLEVGTVFPPFTLPDLNAAPVSLETYRGKQVLLVHWSPKCGFCELMAPDLAALHSRGVQSQLAVLLLAYESAETNRSLAREHGLDCPILLYRNAAIPEPFLNQGTPSAYLLDVNGAVAQPMAVGSPEILELINQALPKHRPLTKSKILRDGLKVGTPAPDFTLPDLQGHFVSLEQYRGERVLLVFSDPHCGPCDQLAPQLARFHREHLGSGLNLILVGRGDPAENRAKAQEHGLGFPVVLQDKWKLSRQYGIFSTPVAFLINEEGIIAADVAVGPESISALAQQGLLARKETAYALSVR